MNIWYGSNENRRLSNLYSRPFWYKNTYYVTVEHAYQTKKSGEFDIDVYTAPWQQGTKRIGRFRANTHNGWNIKLMKTLVTNSFAQNPDELVYLINLKDEVFTHNQDRGIWKKEFPRILTEVRDYFIDVN